MDSNRSIELFDSIDYTTCKAMPRDELNRAIGYLASWALVSNGDRLADKAQIRLWSEKDGTIECAATYWRDGRCYFTLHSIWSESSQSFSFHS
jgi:hypothetical protein